MGHYSIQPRGHADFDLYPYTPSATAAYAFVALFGLGGLVHFGFIFGFRAWFFIPFVLGCIGEAGGYYGRAWSHQDIRNGSPYLLQLMLILSSAPLLAATVYMTLGRLIRSLDAEEHAVLSTRWVTKIYVLIDIGSLVCQIMGSAMQANGDANSVRTGMRVVMIGLGVQLFALACFMVMTAVVHRRLINAPTFASDNPRLRWRKHFLALYGVSGLIIVRSAYRLIEFAEGSQSAASKKEAFLYVFDASLMFLVVVIFTLVHPGRLFKEARGIK